MLFISLNKEKIRHFFDVLFVLLPFSDMAADHWCLSLREISMLKK